MKYVIMPSSSSVNFAPSSEREEVVQNIGTILQTSVGTVPLDRDFGLSASPVDLPTAAAQAKLTVEIIAKVQRYEPRVKVTRVTYESDAGGRLVPRLEVDILEQ